MVDCSMDEYKRNILYKAGGRLSKVDSPNLVHTGIEEFVIWHFEE